MESLSGKGSIDNDPRLEQRASDNRISVSPLSNIRRSVGVANVTQYPNRGFSGKFIRHIQRKVLVNLK